MTKDQIEALKDLFVAIEHIKVSMLIKQDEAEVYNALMFAVVHAKNVFDWEEEQIPTLKASIEGWIAKHGKPSIMVTCRCFNFKMRELLWGGDTKYVILPDVVWPHATIYFENVMARERIEFKATLE